jgi:hypothetical protein
MNFEWTVNKVQVDQDKLIVRVNLTVIGTNGDNAASASYSCTLTRGNTFIPYEQLTEQQVLDWCFAIENFKNKGEAEVISKIERQLAEKQSELALPWVA